MDKVLIKLYVPLIEEVFEAWVPIHKKVGEIIYLFCKSINEMTGGSYMPQEMPCLYDKVTATQLNVNQNVKEAGIRNNTELIMI